MEKILVISTGGTICSIKDPDTGQVKPALSIEALFNNQFLQQIDIDLELINFSQIDSSNMTPTHWLGLHQLVSESISKNTYSGIIILHGTDTLEDTAYFLDITLSTQVPVIITGAMRSADEIDADGPRNIFQSIQVILNSIDNLRVAVVMAGQIFSPRYVTKYSTLNPHAFSSGRVGLLGRIEQGRVKWYTQPLKTQILPCPKALPDVKVIQTYPGDDGALISYASQQGAKGLIIVGFGHGNVGLPCAEKIIQSIKQNVIIVMTTRVREGVVLPIYGGQGGGANLSQTGAIFNHELSPWKARILLMLCLGNGLSQPELKPLFEA